MSPEISPSALRKSSETRTLLARDAQDAPYSFNTNVFADGDLSSITRQIIAVAVAYVTECPYGLRGYTKAALDTGATPEQLMDAISIAAEVRAGATHTHASIVVPLVIDAEPTRVSASPERGR